VTQLEWTTNERDVAQTVGNMTGGSTNAMLWLHGSMCLAYCGLDNTIGIRSQVGLDADDNAVTIILPAGKAKLRMVSADLAEVARGNRDQLSCFTGIEGILEPEDMAWTSMKIVKTATRRQAALARAALSKTSREEVLGLEGQNDGFQ